jgi:uncharacterized membrane protein
MSKLILPGRIFFAAGIIGLGVLQFITGDFIVGRPPAFPEAIPGKLIWAYVTGAVFILSALAIIVKKKGGVAGLIIGVIIIIYSFLLRHLPAMIGSLDGILWSLNAYKALALGGGAFIIAASFFMEENRNPGNFLSNNTLVSIGTVLMALFLFIAGCSHFKYSDFVIGFIPAYIPFHPFFTYFCGVALLAGGTGLLIKKTRKWAAVLSGLMVFIWFLFLHIPRFTATPNDPSDRMGLCESLAISGILFVMAGIFSKNGKLKQPVI